MVEIPCLVRKFLSGLNFAFLPVTIRSGFFNGHVLMMIDTGSPYTVIAPRDAMRFRLSMKGLARRPGHSIHLAGFKFKRHPMGETRLTIRTEKESPITVLSPCFSIIVPTKVNKKILKDVQSIPSIMGIDFLEEHNVGLYFDPIEKLAYLNFKGLPDPDE